MTKNQRALEDWISPVTDLLACPVRVVILIVLKLFVIVRYFIFLSVTEAARFASNK